MSTTALSRQPLLPGIISASKLSAVARGPATWNLTALAGRLIEVSADSEAAHLTAAFGLVLDAQLGGDSAAWVTLEQSSFFPPDVADSGVDLNVLPVVRVPDLHVAARAANHLVRSGGFGLVVLDFSSEIEAKRGRIQASKFPVAALTRLLGLARQQNVAVLFLTKKSQEMPSLNSLISLRVEARWRKRGEQYELSLCALKDKYGEQRRTYTEACRGPAGLR
jgi:recombination protein RecA